MLSGHLCNIIPKALSNSVGKKHDERGRASTSKDTRFFVWLFSAEKVELVLTAHPTEINRRTLLAKHQEVARRLEELEVIERTGGVAKAGRFEAQQATNGLKRAVEALWNSDKVNNVVLC